jgi:hypothetical protein
MMALPWWEVGIRKGVRSLADAGGTWWKMELDENKSSWYECVAVPDSINCGVVKVWDKQSIRHEAGVCGIWPRCTAWQALGRVGPGGGGLRDVDAGVCYQRSIVPPLNQPVATVCGTGRI